MLVITPIAASDRGHLESHVEVIEQLGPYPDDQCMIVITPEAMDDQEMSKLAFRLKSLYANAKDGLRVTPNTPEGGWPLAPSIHFMYALNFFSEMPKQEFYYLETDVIALTKLWLMRLKQDYIQQEKPYYGIIRDTWRLEKEIKPRDPKDPDKRYARRDGTHMVGTGIYPRNYLIRPIPKAVSYMDNVDVNPNGAMVSPTAPSVNTLWNNPSSREPFDIRCQSYHKPCHNSALMDHRWHTKNYRIEDGKLICDNEDETPIAYPILVDGDRVSGVHIVDYSGEVDLRRKVVLHGCKDGSLAKLVLSGELAELMESFGDAPMGADEERETEIKILKAQLASERKQRLEIEEAIARKSAPKGLMHNKKTQAKKVFAELPE